MGNGVARTWTYICGIRPDGLAVSVGDGAAVLDGFKKPVDWVLHVVPPRSGGVDRYVRDVCAIREHDCILHVAAEQVVLEVGRGDRRVVLPLARPTFVDALLRGSIGRPTAMHAHSVLAPVRDTVQSLQLLRRWPYVVTLHDIDFVASPSDVGTDEHNARVEFARSASGLVVPSRYISQLVDKALGCECARVIVPNGVDPAPAFATAEDTTLHITTIDGAVIPPAGTFTVGVIGALGQHKGLDFLREVAAQLRADVRVVVVGYVDGRIEPGWLVEGRIWVHGAFEPHELRSVVARYGCQIALFPNRQPESFCYALSDAWSAGLPALGPDSGALGERIAESGAGWLYPPMEEPSAVARLVERCLTEISPVLQGKVAAAVSAANSRQAMADALQSVYARFEPDAMELPNSEALSALPLVHLDGVFFRDEIRRLTGDIEFYLRQVSQLRTELDALALELSIRGGIIDDLRDELQTLKEGHSHDLRLIADLQEQIRQNRDSSRRMETKLSQDVAETLAAAHRYERALAQIPGPIRGWALRRADNNK